MRKTRKYADGVLSPFVFGTFSLYEGRDAYSLVSVEVQNYFREITENMEAACYGSYFLEFADYYGREPGGGRDLKTSLPVTRALLKSTIPNRLVRAVFELKLMEINGEYMEKPLGRLEDSTIYTWNTFSRLRWKSFTPLQSRRKSWKNSQSAWRKISGDLWIKPSIHLTFWMFLYINDVKRFLTFWQWIIRCFSRVGIFRTENSV